MPTLKEPGFDVPAVPQVRGVVGPPNMPPNARASWENALAKMVKTPEWREFLKRELLDDAFSPAPPCSNLQKTTLSRCARS